ncbi:MAG: hypothetical protein H6923_06110 [Alphaproteobacteria bacterium]|nr:hypothetical protein [Alphaproteobacteria bacterium]
MRATLIAMTLALFPGVALAALPACDDPTWPTTEDQACQRTRTDVVAPASDDKLIFASFPISTAGLGQLFAGKLNAPNITATQITNPTGAPFDKPYVHFEVSDDRNFIVATRLQYGNTNDETGIDADDFHQLVVIDLRPGQNKEYVMAVDGGEEMDGGWGGVAFGPMVEDSTYFYYPVYFSAPTDECGVCKDIFRQSIRVKKNTPNKDEVSFTSVTNVTTPTSGTTLNEWLGLGSSDPGHIVTDVDVSPVGNWGLATFISEVDAYRDWKDTSGTEKHTRIVMFSTNLNQRGATFITTGGKHYPARRCDNTSPASCGAIWEVPYAIYPWVKYDGRNPPWGWGDFDPDFDNDATELVFQRMSNKDLIFNAPRGDVMRVTLPSPSWNGGTSSWNWGGYTPDTGRVDVSGGLATAIDAPDSSGNGNNHGIPNWSNGGGDCAVHSVWSDSESYDGNPSHKAWAHPRIVDPATGDETDLYAYVGGTYKAMSHVQWIPGGSVTPTCD